MAGRQPARAPRRARVHLQVEHGLDARHARVRRTRIRSTAAGSTTSSPSRCCTRSRRTSSCRSRTTKSCTAKASLLDKMPGDAWQKYATLRALYGYMYGHPGKEAAVHGRRVRPVARVEPRSQPRLAPARRPVARRRCGATSRRSTGTTAREPALHECDFDAGRFPLDRLQRQREQRGLVRALRARSAGDCRGDVFNFTPVPRADYRIGVPEPGYYAELLNSDAAVFGGSNVGNGGGVVERAGARSRVRPVAAADGAAARVPAT